jgi:cobalt-zinc-cadmium efflux system outer membrane protein
MLSRFGARSRISTVALTLSVAGCGGLTETIVVPEQSSPAVTYGWQASAPPPGDSGSSHAPSGAITFREAVSHAVAFSPSVKAAYAEIEARHGEAFQASRRLNPELALNVENLPNSGGFAKDDASESLQLSQTIELGGKRLARLAAANLEASLAGWDFEVARLQAATDAAQLFVDVIASQERLAILQEFVTVSQKTRAAVEARVKGGRASPIELDRANVSVALAQASRAAEEARLAAAKARLSALWGSDRATFARAAGRLGRNPSAPSFEEVKAFLEGNPSLARWSDGIGHRYAVLEVERSKAIPNVTVGAGVRRFESDSSSGMIAAVSIPLPLFDRNEGAIAAAEHRIARAEFDAQAARTQLTGTLIGALGAVASANALTKAIESQVLPAAQSAFDRTRTGYEEGKFDLLNVLDTQRTLFEARRELVNARAEYEKARVQVEALIGRDLNGLGK